MGAKKTYSGLTNDDFRAMLRGEHRDLPIDQGEPTPAEHQDDLGMPKQKKQRVKGYMENGLVQDETSQQVEPTETVKKHKKRRADTTEADADDVTCSKHDVAQEWDAAQDWDATVKKSGRKKRAAIGEEFLAEADALTRSNTETPAVS